MIDFWKSAIRQQFHAAIDMLANAIENDLSKPTDGLDVRVLIRPRS